MHSANRTCLICKRKYDFCPNCADYDNQPRWKVLFCSQNCHDIFGVADQYAQKKITKIVAKERLSKLDLSVKDNITGSIRNTVEEILQDEPEENIDNVEVKEEKPVEEPIAKPEPIKEEKVEEPKFEFDSSLPPSLSETINAVSRKRSKKRK